ncbi:MAG TPA: hypothetical protein VGC19_10905 [Rhodanobacter sp.]
MAIRSLEAFVQSGQGSRTEAISLPDPAAQLEQAMAAAREKGYREGLANAEGEVARRVAAIEAGLKRQHEKAMADLDAARHALLQVKPALEGEIARQRAVAEESAVEAAYVAVLKLLGVRDMNRDLIRELCQAAIDGMERKPIALRVSSEDSLQLQAGWEGIELIADAGLSRGRCILETRLGQYETGLDVRLEALKNAFLEGLQQHRSQAA